jgi:redox-sensitive bicupin YhaK (pirin superfamily)
MIQPRPAASRGHADYGWLQTWHSFSFADYYDPEEMGWGALRVINDDIVAPGEGFPMHGHRDMEIVTVILDGALEHRDSMGNGTVIRPGEVQRMSAGSGIRHSEFNPDVKAITRLLQLWIVPERSGITPSYEQVSVPDVLNEWRLLASPDGIGGGVRIQQDARLLRAGLSAGKRLTHVLAPGRLVYVQLIDGALAVNGQALHAGDGARIADESVLEFVTLENVGHADFLIFDLPA